MAEIPAMSTSDGRTSRDPSTQTAWLPPYQGVGPNAFPFSLKNNLMWGAMVMESNAPRWAASLDGLVEEKSGRRRTPWALSEMNFLTTSLSQSNEGLAQMKSLDQDLRNALSLSVQYGGNRWLASKEKASTGGVGQPKCWSTV